MAGAPLCLGLLDRTAPPPEPAAQFAAAPAAVPLVRRRTAWLDPKPTAGYQAAPFARSAPLRSHFERAEAPTVIVEAALESDEPEQVAALEPQQEPTAAPSAPPSVMPPVELPPLVREVPLPTPRPASARAGSGRALPAPSTRYALAESPAAPAPGDGRTLLERMFGMPANPAGSTPALAYATPGDTGGGFFGSRGPASPDSATAVYNIAHHTVTLPDGTRLEAHSGLGVNLDNPGSVTQRMRGATPPSLYDLTQRETLFHGVRALRLTPLLEGTTFGRGGLLAHTFMLGPRGDSNGCVVFRDYAAFLAAYDSGRIRRLLVVAGG